MACRQRPKWEKPAAFKPQCTHRTMTRVYERDSVCCWCRQPGQFGWLYRCTQDIEEIVKEKQVSSLDSSGSHSANGINIRKGDTTSTQNKPGSSDMSPKETAKYTSDQLEIISGQRKQAKDMIAKAELRRSSAALFGATLPPPGLEFLSNDDIYSGQWRCGKREECQYRVCPWCRPGCADRAFLSLDAIANGEIPLTAATGFGFEDIGGRPVVMSEVVKHMGLRGPPCPPMALPNDSWITQYLMLMLDDKVSGCSKEAQRSRNQTEDTLPSPEPPRPLPVVGSNWDAMVALGNAQQRQLPDSNSASQQTYLELLPSTGGLPTATPQEGKPESASQHTLGLDDRRELRRARRMGQLRGESHDTSESAPLFHSNNSRDTDDLLTGFDDDAHEITPAPLRVDRGVGVTEESIETGVPDVVTQV